MAILFKGFVSKDAKLLTRAYVTYVRPILEYCSFVWSPYHLKDIHALERVQRHFTRRLLGFRHYCYSDRLKLLNLETLEMWRLKADLKMYFKILNSHVEIDCEAFFEKNVNNNNQTRIEDTILNYVKNFAQLTSCLTFFLVV